jgi:uncharacterized protein (TIGR02145 family)
MIEIIVLIFVSKYFRKAAAVKGYSKTLGIAAPIILWFIFEAAGIVLGKAVISSINSNPINKLWVYVFGLTSGCLGLLLFKLVIKHKKLKGLLYTVVVALILVSGYYLFISFERKAKIHKYYSQYAFSMGLDIQQYKEDKANFLKLFGDKASTFVDKRDGQEYLTIKIGNQIWMEENLNYATEDSYYYNDNDTINCYKTGRSYKYDELLKIAPEGWHIPSDEDWKNLALYLGLRNNNLEQNEISDSNVYKLISKRSLNCNRFNEGAQQLSPLVNASGFNAVALCGVGENNEPNIGGGTQFWSLSQDNSTMGYIHINFREKAISMSLNHNTINRDTKKWYNPVRCIKD